MKLNHKLKFLFISGILALTGCSNNGAINMDNHFTIETPRYIGRHINQNTKEYFSHSCSGFEIGLNVLQNQNNTTIILQSIVAPPYERQYFNIYIDDNLIGKESIKNETKDIKVATNIAKGKHILKLIKVNEASFSKLALVDVKYSGLEVFTPTSNKKIIEFYGDSITNGFGNLTNKPTINETLLDDTDASKGYAYLVGEELGYETNIIAHSGIGLAMSSAGEQQFLLDVYDKTDGVNPWDMKTIHPDYIVINIGTNDTAKFSSLHGKEQTKALEQFVFNYKTLVMNLKNFHPNCKLIATMDMMIPFHNSLKTAIESVIEYANDNYMEFAYTLTFTPDSSGGVSHPSQKAHEQFAHELNQFIKTID